MADPRHALIIGGHGRAAGFATPKLVEAGFAASSLIRGAEQVDAIESPGATSLVRDVTEMARRGTSPEQTILPFVDGADDVNDI